MKNPMQREVAAKLLAIPPDWEHKDLREVARLAQKHLGIDWVDDNTCMVVTRPGPECCDGMAYCPATLSENFSTKAEKALGRPLTGCEAADIAERYTSSLARSRLNVGVTGSMLCMDVRAEDGSVLEIIAFVQVRLNGCGDGLEWFVDFSARTVVV